MNNEFKYFGNLIRTRCFIFSLVSLFPLTDAVAQTIESSEQSNTGGLAQSESFSLTASIGGQPSPVGEASGGQFAHASGYIRDNLNIPPGIDHTPISSANVDQSITIVATITDENVAAVSAVLKYRKGGESTFKQTNLMQSGGSFQGTIPENFVTDRGLEYKIEATDSGNLTGRAPPSSDTYYSTPVIVGGTGIIKPTSQPSGSAQTAYRMISMPLDLDDKSFRAVLEDDLDPHDNTKWRLVDWQNGWVELPTNKSFTSGNAFFLIAKAPDKRIDSGAGKSNITNQEFSIPLTAGWNMVGNPFNFSIPLNKLSLSSGISLTLWTYDGDWRTLNQGEQIQPFEGYAIISSTTDALIINPDLSSASNEVAKQSTSVNERFLWSINIRAQCKDARDSYNFAAVSPNADLNWDELDSAEPPPIGEYVMVYFPHRDWQTISSLYSTDARPESVNGNIWRFEVRSNIRDMVALSFEGLEQVPQAFDVWLVDETIQIIRNLRDDPFYSFTSPSGSGVKRLQLVVGKDELIAEMRNRFTTIPGRFELAQNFPNPFNPGTTIRYGVPATTHVTVKIFNILGEEVVTLVDEVKSAGYHVAAWDGRDHRGNSVAGGVYIYQVRSSHKAFTKKMLLLH